MKNNLVVLLLLLGVRTYAQIPVTDAALNATANVQTAAIIKDLAEGIAQGETLIRTYKSIKEGIEVYKKVSGFIRDSRTVAGLIQDQYKIIEDAGKTMQAIAKMKLSKNCVINADRNISEILNRVDQNMDLLMRILTDAAIKTDDGQRLAIIEKINENKEEEQRKLDSIKRLYAAIGENAKLYTRIQNQRELAVKPITIK